MAYRATQRTRANAEARRAGIERAARHVIARGGFASASVAAVAEEAECSAGLIYTYFTNREELLRIVFAEAAGHELAVIADTVARVATPGEVAASTVDVFVRRSVAGRRLAHALLLEVVPEPVQIERLRLRRGYVAAIAAALERVGWVEFAEVVARSIVGAVGENLVDLLDPEARPPRPAEIEELITALTAFTRSALGEP